MSDNLLSCGVEGLNAKSSFDDKLNEVLNGIFSSMGGFAMSYFFSTTGFLLFYGLSYKSYASKIKRRIRSLLFPYLIWQCVILIIDTIQGQYTFSFQDFFRKTFFN